MSDRRITGTLGGDGSDHEYWIDGVKVSRDYFHETTPAVGPDNDYEDTLSRFSGLDVTLPPYPGYQPRAAEPTLPATRDPLVSAVMLYLSGLAFLGGCLVGHLFL